MKKSVPRISDTEWEVMRAVWSAHPVTAGQICERLAQSDPSWHPKTARTLISRLVDKGALTYDVDGRIFHYRPLVTEQECIASASESFLDRVFGGALQPMLAHFVERDALSPDEVKELEQILARHKKRR